MIAYVFEDISFKQSLLLFFVATIVLCLWLIRFDTSENHIHIFFIKFQDIPLAFTQIQIIWRRKDLKNLSNIIIEYSSSPGEGIGSVVIFETCLL